MSIKETKTTKIVAGLIGVAMTLSLFAGLGVLTASAQGMSTTDLINLLIAAGIIPADKVAQVQALISGSGSGTTGTTVFTRTLMLGSRGADVQRLQEVLNANGFTVATSGAGSPGLESTYFGPATRAAVIRLQAARGLAQVGQVGPATRGILNQLAGGIVTPPAGTDLCNNITDIQLIVPTGMVRNADGSCTTAPVTAGSFTVTSGIQPSATLAPQSAARVPFTTFTITAGSSGAVINGVRIERQGLAHDAVFAGVVLLRDNGTQVGIARTFGSDHQATVGADDPITIPANTSKTFTIAGNMAASLTSYAGEVPALALVKVFSAGGDVTASIVGAAHTVNSSLAIGSVTMTSGPLNPDAATKNVGTTGYTFSSVKVTNGSVEAVRLYSVRWNQASSAGSSDLANVKTFVDGVEYPTTISTDGKYYTSIFGSGIVIDKGLNKEIYIKGDILGGSSRTVAFNIEKNTDLYMKGETFNYGISAPTTGSGQFSSGSIWFAGATVTINTGSMTVEKATSVTSANIAPGMANQVLGGFSVEVKGEPISVARMVFTGATSSTFGGEVTNATIVDESGAIVAGPVDLTTAASGHTLVFTDTVVFPVGKKVYTIKGKVADDSATDSTIYYTVTPSTAFTTVVGQTTGKTITPSSAAVTMSTMTVKGATLTVSTSNDPAAQTVVAGIQQFPFANFQLSALSSGEDIKISTIATYLTTTGTASNLTNCQIYDGATSLTTGSQALTSAASGSNSFTFDTPLVITKGSVKAITLKCNIASGSTGTHSWGITTAPTATGVTSSQAATVTLNSSTGQIMTLSSGGSLEVALDSSSPSYAIAAAGTTDQVLSILRVKANNEAIKLQGLALQLTTANGYASSSPSDLANGKVTIWDGSTKVGEATFVGSSYVASTTFGTCTGCTDLIIPKDTAKVLTLKGTLAAQGTSQPGMPGALLLVNWDNDTSHGTYGIGQSAGGTIYRTSNADTSASGVRVYRAYPSLALVSLSSSKLTSGTQDLFRFKITASNNGDGVGINCLTYRIATSSATSQSGMIVDTNIYAFTDSSYSTPVSGVQSTGALAYGKLGGNLWASSSSDLRVCAETSGNASTTLVIPAGQTRYFAIKGTATVAGTQYSVSTQLQGDAKFGGINKPIAGTGTASTTYLATSTKLMSDATSFIWTPLSTTTSITVATDNDFSSGYGIPGLPTSNTDAQVLTQ